ncbi:unnamed protein product [Medioppia subpectinata]|uniref:Protein kinase domain-containing protein n=1 Tax=Medioppia subpectinata TaxID=1979941 RepID=A0A7R9QGZ0_9ACAR|nr:unnamed protein product [Medioppia subpectinata]CAG2120120.1 unnamed protein product [Medioppia subpectinata]
MSVSLAASVATRAPERPSLLIISKPKPKQSIDDHKSWSNLSPNLQPPTPPILTTNATSDVCLPAYFGNRYLLVSQFETSSLYRCIDTKTNCEYCCKIVATMRYQQFLSGHLRMDGHSAINAVEEVLVGKEQTYVLFSRSYGDLHLYVRSRKRLRESEAIHLFHQIVTIVADCHTNGIILRDLKLRKFIFANKERTQLKLETLEDAAVLDDSEDDMLSDKHGCPAYVSPEILSTSVGSYSARQADCWSLGVMLYTMLVGRYPFHDMNPSLLFSKIRRGTYVIPDSLSQHAKCLIRSLMRIEPTERLSAEDILSHRWFNNYRSNNSCKHYKTAANSQMIATMTSASQSAHSTTNCCKSNHPSDQTVPDLIDNDSDTEESDSFTQSLTE